MKKTLIKIVQQKIRKIISDIDFEIITLGSYNYYSVNTEYGNVLVAEEEYKNKNYIL